MCKTCVSIQAAATHTAQGWEAAWVHQDARDITPARAKSQVETQGWEPWPATSDQKVMATVEEPPHQRPRLVQIPLHCFQPSELCLFQGRVPAEMG